VQIDTIVAGVVTLAAAFAGSWSAFKLEDRARQRASTRDRIAAINRAQFVLIQQWNTLANLKSQMIDPQRANPVRFIAMRPCPPCGATTPRQEVGELSFLLETDDREIPFLLMLEQSRFDTCAWAVNDRSRLHIDELQPKLREAGIGEGSSWTMAELEQRLGEDLVRRLQRATDAVVEQVDLTVASTADLVHRFRGAMKARYRDERIIFMEPNWPSNQALHPTAAGTVRGRG